MQLGRGATHPVLSPQAQAHRQTAFQFPLLRHFGTRRKVFHHACNIRRRSVDGNAQILAELAAGGLQIPHLRDLEAAAKALGRALQRALHNHQLVVFQQVAVGIEHRIIDRRFQHIGFVVELEDDQLAAVAVDDAQIADDGGQQLRLA